MSIYCLCPFLKAPKSFIFRLWYHFILHQMRIKNQFVFCIFMYILILAMEIIKMCSLCIPAGFYNGILKYEDVRVYSVQLFYQNMALRPTI